MKKYNWGILGCGKIADPFAQGLETLPQANLLSVASRSEERANKLGDKYRAQRIYTDYTKFLEDPDLDIVYVATTHNFHLEHCLMAMRAGKAVLCEKPLTINADEAQQLINYARQNKIFLLEAFWTRYLPSTIEILKWVQQGQIGEIRLVKADFGYYMPFDPEFRSYNPKLAGGALLDVGVYPLNFAYSIFRENPESWTSLPSMSSTGIDQQSAYLLRYSSGAMAILNSGVNIGTKHDAWIYGTEGSIYVMDFFHSKKAIIEKNGEKPVEVSLSFESTGYNYEAQEVMRCLDANLLESPVMTLDESLRILELMDDFRKDWGMKYPGE